ncbi:MAG: AbfB domain-containing protein [Planctomycetota bacterium]
MCREFIYLISFVLVLGLTGSVVQAQDNPLITLEAYDLPGYFVTHAGTGGPVAVLAQAGDQTDAGKFYLVPGLADPAGVPFESVEFPGYYLRHRDRVVRLESDTTDIFNNDANWTLRPGLADPEAVSFESTAGFVGNYLRRLALPKKIRDWSLRTLQVKLIKTGAKVVRHSRYVVFRMAEVVVSGALFREILDRIGRLRASPRFTGAG